MVKDETGLASGGKELGTEVLQVSRVAWALQEPNPNLVWKVGNCGEAKGRL